MKSKNKIILINHDVIIDTLIKLLLSCIIFDVFERNQN